MGSTCDTRLPAAKEDPGPAAAHALNHSVCGQCPETAKQQQLQQPKQHGMTLRQKRMWQKTTPFVGGQACLLCGRQHMQYQLSAGMCPCCELKALLAQQQLLEKGWRPANWLRLDMQHSALKVAGAPDGVVHPKGRSYFLVCPVAAFQSALECFEWWLAKHNATWQYRLYKQEYLRLLKQLRDDYTAAAAQGKAAATAFKEAVVSGRWLQEASIQCGEKRAG